MDITFHPYSVNWVYGSCKKVSTRVSLRGQRRLTRVETFCYLYILSLSQNHCISVFRWILWIHNGIIIELIGTQLRGDISNPFLSEQGPGGSV